MKSRILFGNLYKAEEFAELYVQEKLLAIYLMTNESIGLVPAYKLNKREISFWLGLDQNKIDTLVKKLERIGVYEMDGYVILCNSYSNYIYHMGIDNKNKKAMEKEFALLPTNIQKKLWEFGFDIEGEFKIPYGYLNGTSKVLINKKQETINNKSEIRTHKQETINGKEDMSKELEEARKALADKLHWKN